MGNSLIIKLGALGDVVRTTTILNVLKDDITWITKANAKPLLDNIPKIRCVTADSKDISGKHFSTVYSLDDDLEGCKLLESVTFDELFGFYEHKGRVLPMPEAEEWWKMSLNGPEDRDERKQANRMTFQQHLFNNIGRVFNGENYVLGYAPMKVTEDIIGLEDRAGDRWPMKVWPFYSELGRKLEGEGYKVKIFEQREDIRDYVQDVNSCKLVVAGDSLAMHIALALDKRVVALFGPTNPWEIEMYGRGKRLYANMPCIFCFKKTNCDVNPTCMQSVAVDAVYDAVKGLLR